MLQDCTLGWRMLLKYLAMTGAVMLTAGVLASLVPARRALRINPMEALRDM